MMIPSLTSYPFLLTVMSWTSSTWGLSSDCLALPRNNSVIVIVALLGAGLGAPYTTGAGPRRQPRKQDDKKKQDKELQDNNGLKSWQDNSGGGSSPCHPSQESSGEGSRPRSPGQDHLKKKIQSLPTMNDGSNGSHVMTYPWPSPSEEDEEFSDALNVVNKEVGRANPVPHWWKRGIQRCQRRTNQRLAKQSLSLRRRRGLYNSPDHTDWVNNRHTRSAVTVPKETSPLGFSPWI